MINNKQKLASYSLKTRTKNFFMHHIHISDYTSYGDIILYSQYLVELGNRAKKFEDHKKVKRSFPIIKEVI